MSKIWAIFMELYSLIDKKGKEDMHGNFRLDKACLRTKLEATLYFP